MKRLEEEIGSIILKWLKTVRPDDADSVAVLSKLIVRHLKKIIKRRRKIDEDIRKMFKS